MVEGILHLLYCLDQHILVRMHILLFMIINFMIKLTELIIQRCFELNEAETTQLLEGYGFKPE